jgi:hypothetical protein
MATVKPHGRVYASRKMADLDSAGRKGSQLENQIKNSTFAPNKTAQGSDFTMTSYNMQAGSSIARLKSPGIWAILPKPVRPEQLFRHRSS